MTDYFFSYKILPQQNLIITNYGDKLQMKDLISTTIKFMQDSNYHPDQNLLIDFTGSLALSYRVDLYEFIEFFKKSVKLKKEIKVCILFSSPNQEFLINIYKPLAKLIKMDVEKFRSLNEGLSWLSFNDEDKALISQTLDELKNQKVLQVLL